MWKLERRVHLGNWTNKRNKKCTKFCEKGLTSKEIYVGRFVEDGYVMIKVAVPKKLQDKLIEKNEETRGRRLILKI